MSLNEIKINGPMLIRMVYFRQYYDERNGRYSHLKKGVFT